MGENRSFLLQQISSSLIQVAISNTIVPLQNQSTWPPSPHLTGMPLQAHAAVAKAGVDALSATTALEYGPRGITSNIITPGPISGTEGMARLGSREAEGNGNAYKKVPLQRYGLVKEIADGTIYLFSDAGNYVNGEVLVIDGGDWRSPG